MSRDLTNLYIDETFEYLLQKSGSEVQNGLGVRQDFLDVSASYAVSSSYALTASYALNSVPQVSASHAVNADTASLLIGNAEQVSHIDFAVGGDTGIERRLTWNDTDGTLNVGLKGGNVTLQVGQEEVARVVNGTGADLLEAQYRAVKVIGAQGQRLQVDLAQADSDINSATTLGLVTEDINKNQEGFITTQGTVNKINTTGNLQGETWNDGDVLYLSATTPGALTNVKPLTPGHLIVVGYVEYAHQNNGKIYVKVDNGYELEELHDVLITNPTNGEALVYENGIWINSDIPHISASYAVSSSQAENANTATSASYALTASYALNAGGGGFPYTGSALITGSLGVTGSISAQGPLGGKFTYTNRLNGGLRTNEIDFTGQDITQFRSDDTIAFDNTYFGAGTGSMSFNTNGNLAFNTYAGGDIRANTDGTIDLQAGQDVVLEADNQVQIISNTTTPNQGIAVNASNVNINLTSTGSGAGNFIISTPGDDAPGLLLSLGTGSYGSNPTTANMLFTGDDAFFQAEGTFYIKNVYNDTGSVTVWSENKLTLRGDTGVYIGADPFDQDISSSVEIDIEGKTLLNTVRANVLGFSTSVTDYNVVPDDTRAFVEGPLEIGDNGTIVVPLDSDLKVLDPFGTPTTSAVSASYATTASYALISANDGQWNGQYNGSAININTPSIVTSTTGDITYNVEGDFNILADGIANLFSSADTAGALNWNYTNPSGSIPLGTKFASIGVGQQFGDPTQTRFDMSANQIAIGQNQSGPSDSIIIGSTTGTQNVFTNSSGSIFYTCQTGNMVVETVEPNASLLVQSNLSVTGNSNLQGTLQVQDVIEAPYLATANYADDTAAQAGGIPINGIYRTGNDLKVRLV